LSWQTTEGTLRAHFEKFGELTDVALMIDKRTGQPRGFGFIKMKYPAAADIVVAQEHVIDGRRVDVKKAVPRDRAPAPTRTESKKIFVGGLSADVSDKIFHDYFSKFGIVKDAVVMVDRSTNRSRGFGFVTFESEEAVDNVIKTENTILGKWVEVKRAEPRDMTTRFEVAVGRGGGGPGAFRGGRMGPGDIRGGLGGRGYGMLPNGRSIEDYPSYSGMAAYGRGFGGPYPTGYGPTPTPYGMPPAYPTGSYGAYGGGAYPTGYGPTGPGFANASGYGNRGVNHEETTGSTAQSTSYGTTSAMGTPSAAITSGSYEGYGRGQQYPGYPSTMTGYGGAYGMYTAATTGTTRAMTAQDGYEGAYGTYRQGSIQQNRLDRGYKPY